MVTSARLAGTAILTLGLVYSFGLSAEEPSPAEGIIVDEQGDPFDVDHIYGFSANVYTAWRSKDGRFSNKLIPKGPVALVFVKPGYRSVYLESGRDFKWGDNNIRVVMVKRPYPEFESVFQAVTGHPVSEHSQIPGASDIWELTPGFREYAGNDKSIWLTVRDPEGKPIDRIAVRKSQPHLPEILDRKQALTVKDIARFNNSEGQYKLKQSGVFVSAPGFGWEWFYITDKVMESEPNFLTLSPAAAVTVTVLDKRGKPYGGAYASAVKMAKNWPKPIDSCPESPKLDKSGQMTFDSLGPGEYTFGAWYGNSPDRRKDVIKVEPEKKYSVTLRFDQP